MQNKIIILKDKAKDELVKKISDSDSLINAKFITLSELLKKCLFDYDNRCIYYVSKKYDVIPEIARIYLDNLYYLKDLDDEKVIFLNSLKADLIQNNMLEFDNEFKSYLRDKDIIFYNLKNVDKFYRNILDEIRLHNRVTDYDDKRPISIKPLYMAQNKEEEVSFIASYISKLLEKGIDINKIKLANVSKDYIFEINKIFKFYGIPVELPTFEKAKGTILVQKFKELYSENMEDTLEKLKDYVKDDNDKDLYKSILNIINSYAWCDNYLDIRDYLFKDVDNIIIKGKLYENAIRVIDFKDDYIDNDTCVILMNYNLGVIPTIYKDEDYLNDEIKEKLNLSTSNELNKNSVLEIQNKIRETKHLIVTYSKHDIKNELYISSSYDESLFENKDITIDYDHSDDYNKIRLIKALDENKKYGDVTDDLVNLGNHYNIDYESFDNRFKGLDKEKLNNYLDNKLSLAYTGLNEYYKCSFRYYLDYIVKVNKYEDTFQIVIGNIFHKILSECFVENYDFDKRYEEVSKETGYEFNNMEKFFLNRLKDELKLVIDTIKEQYEYTSLKKAVYEKRIAVNLDGGKVVFKGFVDKILYDFIDGENIAVIIDYKTGNPELNINNVPYGMDMQLPVYVYLVKKAYKNVRIGGFYLQKILNTDDDINKRKDGLKLQGYSNSDTYILEKVDNSYENSKIIKSMKVTSKGFAAYSKILDDDEIDKLCSMVEDKIEEASKNILDGKFDVNPKKIDGKLVGCKFCKYADICYKTNSDIVELKPLKYKEFLGGYENAKMD